MDQSCAVASPRRPGRLASRSRRCCVVILVVLAASRGRAVFAATPSGSDLTVNTAAWEDVKNGTLSLLEWSGGTS